MHTRELNHETVVSEICVIAGLLPHQVNEIISAVRSSDSIFYFVDTELVESVEVAPSIEEVLRLRYEYQDACAKINNNVCWEIEALFINRIYAILSGNRYLQ